jgi:D-serine deaminase-like pyridoxal phosphate-dependent protein
MAAYIIHDHGLAWRPHMKGQKAPELAREAVSAGACGFTFATLYESEAMLEAAIENVLLANQVAGTRKLARLARLSGNGGLIVATDTRSTWRKSALLAVGWLDRGAGGRRRLLRSELPAVGARP